MYVTINQDVDGKVFEVFTSIGKAGGCAQSQAEAIGRLIGHAPFDITFLPSFLSISASRESTVILSFLTTCNRY